MAQAGIDILGPLGQRSRGYRNGLNRGGRMLWFILIFFVLMAIPAVLISARNQGVMMDALAMHENLKRNHPDDPLAQLGPHEFQRIFHRAQINRGKPTINRGFLWFFLAFSRLSQ